MSLTVHGDEFNDGQRDFHTTVSLDHVQDYGLVSYETRQIFQTVNYVFISGPLSACGLVGNIFNIVVFTKQGFKDSMNISLLGLATADLLCLLTLLWTCICYNPLLINADVSFDSLDLMYLTGGYSHVCFNRVTSFITAFITLERCLCITMPLKVKSLITSTRTKAIIISIYFVIIATFVPLYFVNTLEWNFNSARNRTILSLAHMQNREVVEIIVFLIQAIVLSTISLVCVIICTIILIIKLNEKSKWRQTATGGTKGASTQKVVSVKEQKVVKMVTFISVIFIICYVPASLIIFMMFYEPEFSFTGKYENIFFIVWSYALILQSVSSSVNIFVYYNMSSKYRITFTEIFCKHRKLEEKNPA